jgi:hypothetical protein
MAKIRLNNVRLSFPALFEPKSVSDGDKPAYSGVFLLDPKDPQLEALDKAVLEAATEKWGAKAPKLLEAIKKADKTCVHDGNRKSEYAGFEDMLYVSARNPVRPLVIDTNKSQLSEADGRPYGGCYVNASLEIWAQDNQYGKRVNATLLGVQFHRDGEAFGGARAGSPDDFDDVSDGAEIDPESLV